MQGMPQLVARPEVKSALKWSYRDGKRYGHSLIYALGKESKI